MGLGSVDTEGVLPAPHHGPDTGAVALLQSRMSETARFLFESHRS